uniref:Uncharacterized protein n=1 Tax=viral metagenome TaxID=1070528 RepID=A0A6M3KGG5_9ZZZZ
MKKPTTDEIINDLLPGMESIWDAPHTKFREDDKFYELEFKDDLGLPVEFANQGIVLPTARDMVDTFVDHIDISNGRVFVNKKSASDISAEEAEMMRKLYLGLIYRTNVDSDISPWRVAAKHYAKHGLAVMKTIWDADRWPDKPLQKSGESEDTYAERLDKWRSDTSGTVPIIIQAVNPQNILGDPSYPQRQFVIERHERLCWNIRHRWQKWSNPSEKSDKEFVTFVSYWDDTYRADFADGEPLLPGGVVKHNYGFLPYVFIDSGLGDQAPDADMSKRYVGMLRYIFDILISESRDYSIADVVLPKISWGGGFLMGENAEAQTEISQEFGKWNKLKPGVTAKSWAEMNQTPPDMLNMHLARSADYIAAHAAPRAVRGLGESGVRSGADRKLVIAEASARYKYSKDSFKNGTAKVLINCAKLLKNVIPGDVRIWARTPTDEFDIEVKKDKMKEPFTCYVEFSPISDEDEYRRHDDLERLTNAGIVTRNWARTQMSNVDPIAMAVDEEKEKLKNSEVLNMLIQQYAAGKMAEAISKRGGAEMVQGGEPAQPPTPQNMRPMVPGIPNIAPLGGAQDLQNQMAQNRSQISPSPTQGRGGGGS